MGRCVPSCCCPQPQRQRQHRGYRRMCAHPVPSAAHATTFHLCFPASGPSWQLDAGLLLLLLGSLRPSQKPGADPNLGQSKGKAPTGSLQPVLRLPRARGLIASLAHYPASLACGSSPPQNTSLRSCHPLSSLTSLFPGPKQHRQEPRGTKPSSGPEREQQGEIRDAESDRSAWNEARRLVLTPLKMGRVPPEHG